jgi:hypothetical protein
LIASGSTSIVAGLALQAQSSSSPDFIGLLAFSTILSIFLSNLALTASGSFGFLSSVAFVVASAET